ncbi:hypothetical protein [Conexibacter sp. SYSU D00693]|uniref:hypothetical protein n=1 Tax=Conexibacter sp. SYSU D00693 TaxID=2812560 RepID=UPI00196AA306|nr:hypothetical protein [Conexibacter sp. SYSU D00693]
MACPACGAPLEPALDAEHVLGFRLLDDDLGEALPVALAQALSHLPTDEPPT